MDIASVQSIQHAINDLKKTAPEDEFTAIESLFKEKIEDQQVLKQNIDTLFNRTYGDKAQDRKSFYLLNTSKSIFSYSNRQLISVKGMQMEIQM